MRCKHRVTVTICRDGCLGWYVAMHDFWCQVAIAVLFHVLYEPERRRWELSYMTPPFEARSWQSV